MIVHSHGLPIARRNLIHTRNSGNSSPTPQSDPEEKPDLSVKEGAWVGAVIGLSLGTAGGAYVGKYATVAGAAVAGFKLASPYGPVAQVGGAMAGAAVAYLEEEKVGVGKTVGGLVGLASGALIGGTVGAITALFI